MVFIHHILPQSAMIIHWLCYCTAKNPAHIHIHSKQAIKILHRFVSTPSKQWRSCRYSFPLQAINKNPTQIRIHSKCKWICAGYLLLVYVCIGVGDSVILLNPCILCACHKLRPEFSTSHVVVVSKCKYLPSWNTIVY
jgi:hypothetical protein